MTIASLLQGCGYSTAMVGKWHLGFTNYGTDKPHEGGPVDRGFDRYFGIPASTDIPPYYYIRDRHMVAPPTEHIDGNHTEGWSRIQGAFWRKGKIAPNLELDEVLPRFTEESIKTIREHQRNEQEKPLMLYVAFPSPHTPWLPTDPHKGIGKAGLYGEFVAMVDDMVGRILNALDQEGMADNTIVIFTSDNGPVWYDRDMKRFGHDSAGGWRGMKGDAWEAGHRMPFIVRWPGRVEAGTSSSQLICFTDLLATLADLHGVDLPSNGGEDSISFLPVLLNRNCKAKSLRQTFIMQAGNEHFAVRKGPWKLITRLGSGGFSKPRKRKPKPGGPKGQLYNLDDDPGETDNLWLKQPEKVRELTALLNHCRTAACRAR